MNLVANVLLPLPERPTSTSTVLGYDRMALQDRGTVDPSARRTSAGMVQVADVTEASPRRLLAFTLKPSMLSKMTEYRPVCRSGVAVTLP